MQFKTITLKSFLALLWRMEALSRPFYDLDKIGEMYSTLLSITRHEVTTFEDNGKV